MTIANDAHNNAKRILPAHANEAWCVTIEQRGGAVASQRRELFDAVVVASGQFSEPSVPRSLAPGFNDAFRGVKLHSSAYRSPEQFANKRVLLVGIGNTAMDLVCF